MSQDNDRPARGKPDLVSERKDVVQAPTGERPDDPWEGAPPPSDQLEDNERTPSVPSLPEGDRA